MLPFVAVIVGLVLFEATMVMSTSLCGELYLFSNRRRQHVHGVMWSGGHCCTDSAAIAEAKRHESKTV